MKLRIKGNSLRLRVSRSELEQLLAGHRVEETIHFTSASPAKLTYALESALQASAVRVCYRPQEVAVILSEDQARIWGKESEVGVYTAVDIGLAGALESSLKRTSPVWMAATKTTAIPSTILRRDQCVHSLVPV